MSEALDWDSLLIAGGKETVSLMSSTLISGAPPPDTGPLPLELMPPVAVREGPTAAKHQTKVNHKVKTTLEVSASFHT